MAMWTTDPLTTKKTLNKDAFLDEMERHWDQWAKQSPDTASSVAWSRAIEDVFTSDCQSLSDLSYPFTWARVTVQKILFPNEFFSSKNAAYAQVRFPEANLDEWKLNKNGPTHHKEFQQNEHMCQEKFTREFEVGKKRIQICSELAGRPWYNKRRRGSNGNEPPLEQRRSSTTRSTEQTTYEESFVIIPSPEDTGKVSEFDRQLASARSNIEANIKVRLEDIDALQQAYQAEIAEIHKAHRKEAKVIRDAHKGLLAALNKVCVDGSEAFHKVDKLNKDKN
ncbi:hypothetical protein F53441_11842 [Fusarium austroafricanum]|uniref:Uncharacterized protein n=1 Tax=Fusarium austroafricanum TaxID=2364996 RepID=A0A8H4NY82_9HYPO|nr:hypothetical protein F53441_11842 [Fusarium austroafricanum]